MTVRTDPKTGRMYTVAPPAPIDLEKARRECRDVIQGNVPFHVDPFAASVETALPAEIDGLPLTVCMCAFVGHTCAACLDAG